MRFTAERTERAENNPPRTCLIPAHARIVTAMRPEQNQSERAH
jgi:hypothetical protein